LGKLKAEIGSFQLFGLLNVSFQVSEFQLSTSRFSAFKLSVFFNFNFQLSKFQLFPTPMVTILEAGRAEKNYWRDLWHYRELFQVLAWRDVSVRYKQTVIGVAWALIRPFLTMIVFTVIFGRVAKLPTEGTAPYALMVFAGMLPWTFFATALSEASGSLISNANLISKVYFPRLIVPTATVVVAFIDFLISFVILVGMMVWYQFLPGWQILLLPVFIALAFFASLGPGLWITALNVKYRDFRYVIPFIVQFGLYISPVGFSSSVIPEQWRLLYSLNPMVGVIDGFRWCILGGESAIDWPAFGMSLAVTVFFLLLGIKKFRAMEKSFADLI
jgi:lipopolysaccharide transport system permease protein